MWRALKAWAQALKRQMLGVYFIARDGSTPAYLRLLAFAVAAYALSPIDLIPDFIPILGLLDDLLIVPVGLALVLWLVPAAVKARALERAQGVNQQPVSFVAAAVVILLWLVLAGLLIRWLY
jgi:uncharacterized membrane protein YkvA (DUF1232 family)